MGGGSVHISARALLSPARPAAVRGWRARGGAGRRPPPAVAATVTSRIGAQRLRLRRRRSWATAFAARRGRSDRIGGSNHKSRSPGPCARLSSLASRSGCGPAAVYYSRLSIAPASAPAPPPSPSPPSPPSATEGHAGSPWGRPGTTPRACTRGRRRSPRSSA